MQLLLTPHPDWWPDPEGGSNTSNPGNDKDPNGTVAYVGKGISSVISQVLNIVLSTATQASTGTSPGTSSTNKLNTSIQALKETQNLQKQNLDKLLGKVTATKNQQEYSKLINQYSQQKEQYQKIGNLINHVDYAMQNKDYVSVANDVKNYTQQQSQSTNSNQSPNNKDWQDSTNSNLQQSLNSSFNSNASYNDYSHPQAEVSNSSQTNPNSNSGDYGKVLSGGLTLKDLTEAMGKDANKFDEAILKKAFATYNSPVGAKIEQAYQLQLQANVEKILKECIDGVKAAKLAGEIAKSASKYLAIIYIFEQGMEGYKKGGIHTAIEKSKQALLEIVLGICLTKLIELTGLAAIPSFFVALIIIEVFTLILNNNKKLSLQ